jgi:hypothetical protein
MRCRLWIDLHHGCVDLVYEPDGACANGEGIGVFRPLSGIRLTTRLVRGSNSNSFWLSMGPLQVPRFSTQTLP